MAAESGWTFADHVHSTQTLEKLPSSRWDFVVLQEQSEIPALEQTRTASMYPAARLLVHQIERAGATPIFFVTWAHRDGLPEDGLPNYESMQLQIDQGYLGIAAELDHPVAPVVYAWSAVTSQDPALGLWQTDGSHPTELGTYLAACVFYAVIFRQSPVGLSYLGHLSKGQAQLLQAAAANTVLNSPRQWNLR
ncbi:MAG: DUF4886 domain-containing protein [Anaerolineales bacterium]|jgi:hypothetical protein